MDIKLDEYVKEYFHISREEMGKIRKEISNDNYFETKIRYIHDDREKEKQHGRPSLRPQPLAHIMSIIVKRNPNQDNKQQFTLYGTISAHFFDAYKRPVEHQIYKRESDIPEILGTDGSLTLTGPDYSDWPDYTYLPLSGSIVNVNLLDQTNTIFAHLSFSLDDFDDIYDQVKSMVVHCQQGSLTLQYIAIPFGLHCRLHVGIPKSKRLQNDEIVNVNGKIVARYADTYGNYLSQECVLFNKQDIEFERVEIGHGKWFPLSRCWVSSPAYSSLVIEVDLLEFGSGRMIGKGTIKLLPQQGLMSGESLLLDDININVSASWFSPQPLGRNDYKCTTSLPQIPTKIEEEMEQECEEMDTDGEDESSSDDDESPVDGESPCNDSEGGIMEQEGEEMDSDEEDKYDESPCDESKGGILQQKSEEMDTDGEDGSAADDDESHVDEESGDVLSSSLDRCSWCLRSHKHKPWPSPAMEIFSVFIGQEKAKALQIYGSIEVLKDDEKLCDIFKRDEKDALGLSENLKFIPIPDGSRIFDDDCSLKMKFDIKDVEGCLAIKGYVHWAATAFDTSAWIQKQLCNFIKGQHGGFAAIHYSLFNDAVRVTIKVSLNIKTWSFDVKPKVWGSLVTQYSNYDYSSRYNKDYYRSVLFKRSRDDLVQVSDDSTILLSRSTIVVPSYSSLIVNVDLSVDVSDQKLSCAKRIEIGERNKTIETNDYLLHFELDWCEIK